MGGLISTGNVQDGRNSSFPQQGLMQGLSAVPQDPAVALGTATGRGLASHYITADSGAQERGGGSEWSYPPFRLQTPPRYRNPSRKGESHRERSGSNPGAFSRAENTPFLHGGSSRESTAWQTAATTAVTLSPRVITALVKGALKCNSSPCRG